MTAKQITKQFNAIKKRIAKERDKLRDLVSEINDVEECSGRAVEAMEEAADALSEYL